MTAGPRPFALRDYAFLADGERGILVGPRGEMAWMCFPSWDSPSIFTSLLGGAGHYQVVPADDRFVWGGYYEESTLIWNSRWITTDSVIECREALVFPADPSRAVVLRRVRAVDGPARITARLDLRADYGRRPMTDVSRDGASWRATSGPVHLRWHPGSGVRRLRGGELSLRVDLAPGQHRDLILELSTTPITGDIGSAESLWQATAQSWHDCVPAMAQVRARRDAAHAYAVMRGMTTAEGA
ncbi:MAG: trehalase-like domain-containing protein, partial [Acidimicrobiales bacterium]